MPSTPQAAPYPATNDRQDLDPGHLLRERRRLLGEQPPSWVKQGVARRLATALRQSSRVWMAAAAILAAFLGFFGLLQLGMSLWQAATAATVAVILVQQGIIHTMGEANAALADRLEGLEDRSWEIRESEELHRSVAEAFGDVLIQRNRDGDVRHANETYSSLFDQQRFALPESDIDAGTRDIMVETTQGQRWFAWRDLPARDLQSGMMGIRSIARDITARKNHEHELAAAAAAAQAASEAKSRFLATISHEVRTPLNGVMGVAQLLARTPLDATQRDHLSILKTSGDTLLALIEDLLDTARMEQGDLSIQTEPVKLEQLLEGVAAMMASRAAAKSLPISTYIDPTLPASILADGGRLRQVLVNLLGNALKFTDQGSVSLCAHRHSIDELCLVVSDTGPGIADKDRDRIFQPFVQTDDGSTRAHNGAGLGLAISRHIVVRMGGDISVSTGKDSGSVFTVTLPLVNADKRKIEIAAPPLAPSLSPKTIALEVDDGPAGLAFEAMLCALGYTVDASADLLITDRNDGKKDDATIHIGHFGHGDEIPHYGRWLTWPVRRETLSRVLEETTSPQVDEEQQLASTPKMNRKLSILLAEDEAVNAMIARSLLEGCGHTITVVENGEQAVAEAVTGQFDIVFLDRHMPVMDGFDALDTIHEFDPAQPVVILSADGQQESRDDAAARGAMGYLIKPFDLEATDQLLARVLNPACQSA
ncbi:ATP-binding protein [Ahrensia sp. R2A130]|uniref:ATP-binding protein n=1 Tax=Ahrensia sp. R2A130 TaxID=744979 RepID=UPI0001E0D831|nr:ATP-binding protein [Ahrensia sp. R2A130]EFL89794.1 two-component sensor/response regulator hybrid [Ahrensia sp. R2A130]